MAFNHYARLQRIISEQETGWYIVRINSATKVQNFKGETVTFDHYYRLYDASGQAIKFGKFQQIERFSRAVNIPVELLPVVESVNDAYPPHR